MKHEGWPRLTRQGAVIVGIEGMDGNKPSGTYLLAGQVDKDNSGASGKETEGQMFCDQILNVKACSVTPKGHIENQVHPSVQLPGSEHHSPLNLPSVCVCSMFCVHLLAGGVFFFCWM